LSANIPSGSRINDSGVRRHLTELLSGKLKASTFERFRAKRENLAAALGQADPHLEVSD
jgi:hypothetical protein